MPSSDLRYSSGEWKRLRLAVLERDHWACQVRDRGCTHGATSVDHVVPTVEGGAFYDPTNLRASCHTCNATRGARLAVARQARYATSVATYVSRW